MRKSKIKNQRSKLQIKNKKFLIFGLYFCFLIFDLLFFSACGSNESPSQLNPSEAVVSKTLLLTPQWPEELQKETVELNGYLKGEDSQGKSTGALGPVKGLQQADSYKFIFTSVPSEFGSTAVVTIDIAKSGVSVSPACQLVAKVVKEIEWSSEEIVAQISPSDFDLSPDCDGDGVTNLSEFQRGLNVEARDSDGDGTLDLADLFPLDPAEALDQDGDLLGDHGDNCPSVANERQEDWDSDSLGDACDSDWDSDQDGILDAVDNCPSLSNTNQEDLDRDHQGDLCDEDRDGDGVANTQDNCAGLNNADQANGDGDPLGNACDCDPADANRYDTANDDPDPNSFDSNCDGIDGNRANAVFVPTAGDLNGAIALALESGKDVYVEEGSYTLNETTFSRGVRLFGGYQRESRCVYPACPNQTVLNVAGPIEIRNIEGSILFDGFKIEGDLIVENASVVLSHNEIETETEPLTISGNSQATLETNFLDGGVLIDGADAVLLRDNILLGGRDRIAIGLEVHGASPQIQNNTIDATVRYTAPSGVSTSTTSIVVSLENALNIDLTGNILKTGGADDQYLLRCQGLEPAASGITDNLFVPTALPGFFIDLIPRSISCQGEFDFLAGDGLDLGLTQAQGNFDFVQGMDDSRWGARR